MTRGGRGQKSQEMDDVIYGQPQEKSPKTLGKDSSRMHKKFIYCLDDGEYFPI